MRCTVTASSIKVWLSAADTYAWANREDNSWPGSTIAGHRLFAEYDRNGLCDFALDGRTDTDVDAREMSAMVADHIASKVPADHALRFIAVDQHRHAAE